MDFNFVINNTKAGDTEKVLYNYAPNLYQANHRLQKTLFRRCTDQIKLYETCLGFSWKSNINQNVSEELRKKCYNEWNQVSTCAKKNLGDSYALKLELARKLPDSDNSEENLVSQYIQMTNARLDMIKGNFPSEEAEE